MRRHPISSNRKTSPFTRIIRAVTTGMRADAGMHHLTESTSRSVLLKKREYKPTFLSGAFPKSMPIFGVGDCAVSNGVLTMNGACTVREL